MSGKRRKNLETFGFFLNVTAENLPPLPIVETDKPEAQEDKIQGMLEFISRMEKRDALCDELSAAAAEIYAPGSKDRDTLELNLASNQIRLVRRQVIVDFEEIVDRFGRVLDETKIGMTDERQKPSFDNLMPIFDNVRQSVTRCRAKI